MTTHDSTRTANRRCSGFTLPELLVALAVAAILAIGSAAGIPRLLENARMSGEVNRMISTLHLARNEAVKHARRIVLCPSPDRVQCGHALDWPQGWLLFASEDPEHDPDEPLLRNEAALQTGIRLYTGNGRSRIVFQPDGSAGGSNSSFTFCAERNRATPRVICLSGTGRPRLSSTRCDGTAVLCP